MPKINSKRLHELRERKVLTQRELAELAEVGMTTIVRAEKGRGLATQKVIKKLAGALGVEPAELIEWDDERKTA